MPKGDKSKGERSRVNVKGGMSRREKVYGESSGGKCLGENVYRGKDPRKKT